MKYYRYKGLQNHILRKEEDEEQYHYWMVWNEQKEKWRRIRRVATFHPSSPTPVEISEAEVFAELL